MGVVPRPNMCCSFLSPRPQLGFGLLAMKPGTSLQGSLSLFSKEYEAILQFVCFKPCKHILIPPTPFT